MINIKYIKQVITSISEALMKQLQWASRKWKRGNQNYISLLRNEKLKLPVWNFHQSSRRVTCFRSLLHWNVDSDHSEKSRSVVTSKATRSFCPTWWLISMETTFVFPVNRVNASVPCTMKHVQHVQSVFRLLGFTPTMVISTHIKLVIYGVPGPP